MQTVTQHHVLQKSGDIKAQQKQQLDQYAQDQIVSPAQSYFNETLKEHLQGLAPNLTAVSSFYSGSRPCRAKSHPGQAANRGCGSPAHARRCIL